jgi:hypothetical protein
MTIAATAQLPKRMTIQEKKMDSLDALISQG